MGDCQHTVVLRPGHDVGQRRDHARLELAFRLATKGHRIITQAAAASRDLMYLQRAKCHSRRSSTSSIEQPSPAISSAVCRARPNGEEYTRSKVTPRASNAARVASACSRPRAVSGESCPPCKMFCTLSSVCPCRTKYKSATRPPLAPPQRGQVPLWWFTAGSHHGDAQLHQYVGKRALGTWCTCASSRQ